MRIRQNLGKIALGVTVAVLAALLFYLPFSGAIANPLLQSAQPTPPPLGASPTATRTPAPSPSVPEESEEKLYWTDLETDEITRANPDGTDAEDVVSTDVSAPVAVAADAEAGKVYWAEAGPPSAIKRSNLDGSDLEDLIILEAGESAPLSIALDKRRGKIYWCDADGKIRRANLDGTSIEVVVTQDAGESLVGITLDIELGKIYWTNRDDATILRANLDGTRVEVLVTLQGPGDAPLDIQLDLRAGKMYWTNLSGKIQRANLDGTRVEVLVVGISAPYGIALDLEINKVYWTEPDSGLIKRANLDGSAVEVVVSGLAQPRDVLLIVVVIVVQPQPQQPPPPPLPPTPVSATASLLDDNNLIVRVTGSLDRPGKVFIRYRNTENGDLFRTTTASSRGRDFTVHITRLRAETSYEFEVIGVDAKTRETSAPLRGSFVTGALPPGLNSAAYEVIQGEPTHELTLMDFNNGAFRGMVAIDGEGEIVWHYDSGEHSSAALAQKRNYNIAYMAEHESTQGYALIEVSPLGRRLDRLNSECDAFGLFHHDIEALSSKRSLFLSREIRPFGTPPVPQGVPGDTIWLWDQIEDEAEMVWSVFDVISPAERTLASNAAIATQPMWAGCVPDTRVQDWTGGTSLSRGTDGSVLYSAAHLNQIVSIARDFESAQWRLGGPNSSFSFPDPSDRFYGPQSVSLLPNGNVLLFDSGEGRPTTEGGPYSRALELELDFDSREARKVWEYSHDDPDLFDECCSSVQRLENGNTLIVFGADSDVPACCRTFTIVEVDIDGNLVWEVQHSAPFKHIQYGGHAIDSIMGEVRIGD